MGIWGVNASKYFIDLNQSTLTVTSAVTVRVDIFESMEHMEKLTHYIPTDSVGLLLCNFLH